MKIGKDGLLYVLQWSGNGKVKRYDLEGNWIDDFTKTAVPTSIGIDWDSSGNLYVSSYSSKYVEKFNADGESLGKFIASGLSGPTNIEFDEDGNLLVLDYDAGVVRKFDKNGNKISDLTTGVGQCEGLHLLQNGNLLVGVGSKSSIKEYNKNGQFIKDVVLQGNLGLKTPNAVVVRPVSTKTINPKYSNAWLYSCSGNECTPNKELIQSIESVEIYNSTGQLVQKLKPDQSFSKDSPEQILIAVGINGEGKILHQIIL